MGKNRELVKDITPGYRYKKLKVIRQAPDGSHGAKQWECKCLKCREFSDTYCKSQRS